MKLLKRAIALSRPHWNIGRMALSLCSWKAHSPAQKDGYFDSFYFAANDISEVVDLNFRERPVSQAIN